MGADPIGTPPADTIDLDADVSNNGIYDPAVFDAAHAQIITAGADNTWGTADDLVKSIYQMDPSEQDALGAALKALPQSELDKIYAKGDDKLDAFVKNLLGCDKPDPTPKPDQDWGQVIKMLMALLCRPQQGGGGCGSGGGSSGGGGQSGGGCGSGGGMGGGCGSGGMGMGQMGQGMGMGMNQGIGQNMGPYNYAYGNGNLFNNQNQNQQGQKGFDVNGDGKNDMFAVPMGNGQSIMVADANGNGQLDQGDSIIGVLPVMGQNTCGMGMNGMDMLPQMFGAMPWFDDKARTGAAPQIVINIQAPSQFFAQANR
jgi:hypothetical protein